MRAANERYRKKWNVERDYYATETFSGTVWHELGHAIDISTGQRLSKELSRNTYLDAASVQVSAYAASTQNVRVSKRSEAWAENYSAYMDGGRNKAKVPPKIAQMIKSYNNGTIKKIPKGGIIKHGFNLHRSEDIPTVILPRKEYGKVMHELNTNLSKEERERFIVSKAIGDYIYTIENYGFNDYRIIGKKLIEDK